MPVQWWSVLPFAALLACIAVFPLVPRLAHRWEHRGFQLAIALALGLPMALWMWLRGESHAVIHAVVEYAQFITLLLSLFVVSGGIFMAGDIRATPRNNTVFLAVGALLASFIGTTGAAMLLIRPLLNTNQEREHKVHTVVFGILLVANCGGLLTPLGDPPLFLGMLRGVPFAWTFGLVGEWLLVNGLLLLTYYALDRQAYAMEPASALRRDALAIEPLSVHGKLNFLAFAAIVFAVATLPSIDLEAVLGGQATLDQWLPWRELVMLGAAALSFGLGDKQTRFVDNKFSWGPIQEVAALFIGIFLTMVPALQFLGQIAPSLPLNEITLFVFTGGLSSVLDNAPTYATFFEMARQLPGEPRIAGVPEAYLVSISLGAVLCGAMTYIGNGPNFMVKAVAESREVEMPSFGGYLFRWALRYLAPILAIMVLVFIVNDWRLKALGALLALGYAAWCLRTAYRIPLPQPPITLPGSETAPASADSGSEAAR